MGETLIPVLAWAVAIALTLPAGMFIVECLLGLAGGAPSAPAGQAPPFVVLMPAHDEARGLGATITHVLPQLRPCDRLLVIADNCTDDTAAIARAYGAEVVVRDEPGRRGKGYALAAGRAALASDPPPVVIVVDADCLPADGALPSLASAAIGGNALQGLYLMAEHADGTARTGLSTFAFLIKNLVRQRGLKRLGGPALLQGSGMAFGWAVFADAPLASADIVEDLELGLSLALAGVPVRFHEPARFLSQPSSGAALAAQRTRWEHGAIAVALRFAPKLALAVLQGRWTLLPLLLDILVPPLALLIALSAAASGLAGVFAALGGDPSIALWMLAMLTLLGATIVAVWFAVGRRILPFSALLRVPSYILWKLPIYARLAGRRERRWVRTERG